MTAPANATSSRLRRTLSFLKWPLAALATLYFVYVAGVAILLNTSLFRKIAGMGDDALTHINLKGAFSPFPGYLHINEGEVFISDQNVSITVHVSQVSAWFNLRNLKEKVFLVRDLHVKNAWVDLKMKTKEEAIAHLKKYINREDVDLDYKIKHAEETRKNGAILDFKHIVIDRISEVKTAMGTFKGDLSVDGGFRIQPTIEVEIYPTRLTVLRTDLQDNFTGLEGTADVQFDPFFIPTAPGNAVFPYVNVKLELQGHVQSLHFLNTFLYAIPQYELSGGGTPVKASIVINKGHLEKGSRLYTNNATNIIFESPNFTSRGIGSLEWKVLDKRSSRATVFIRKVKIDNKQNKEDRHGTVDSMRLKFNMIGTDLWSAFNGIEAEWEMKKMKFSVYRAKTKKKDIKVRASFEGEGTLVGIAGIIPPDLYAIYKKRPSQFNLRITSMTINSNFFVPLEVAGNIRLATRPLDLSVNTVVLPEIAGDFTVTLDPYGKTEGTIKVDKGNYLVAPIGEWKGHMSVSLKDTEPFVKALKAENEISSLGAGVAKVKDLNLDLDWGLQKKNFWMHLNKVQSSGSWTAFGSLKHDADGMQGAFEVRVLRLPVGIRIDPEKMQVKLFPGTDFYEQTLN